MKQIATTETQVKCPFMFSSKCNSQIWEFKITDCIRDTWKLEVKPVSYKTYDANLAFT